MFLLIVDSEFEVMFIGGKFPYSNYHLTNLVENIRLGFKPHLENVLWAIQGKLHFLFSKGLDVYELMEKFIDRITNDNKILSPETILHNSKQLTQLINEILEGKEERAFLGNKRIFIVREKYKENILKGRAKIFLGSSQKTCPDIDNLPFDAIVHPKINSYLRAGTSTIAIYQQQLTESFHFIINFTNDFWQIKFLKPIISLRITFAGEDYKGGFSNDRILIPSNLNNFAVMDDGDLIWTILDASPGKGVYKLSWEGVSKNKILANWISGHTLVQTNSPNFILEYSFVGQQIYYF
jgi:hypothetical protein